MGISAAAAPADANRLPYVRLAAEDDLNEILAIGRELWTENGLMSLDEAVIRDVALQALRGIDGVIGVIGKRPIQAMIFLALRQYWYSKELHLEEYFAYVRPEFRRSKNAIALIEFAKATAGSIGVPLLIGIVSNSSTHQKIRLYQRRLGKPSGAYFLWNGHTGKDA